MGIGGIPTCIKLYTLGWKGMDELREAMAIKKCLERKLFGSSRQ